MSERDERAGAKLWRGALAGAVAGVVASFVMDRFQAATSPMFFPDDKGGGSQPATVEAADAVARAVAHVEVPAPDKPFAGQAVHYALGLGLGLAYGVAAEFRPEVTRGGGAAFALGTATLLDETAVPAIGLGDAPWNAGVAANLYSYASHLAFGLTAEAVRRSVARTLTP